MRISADRAHRDRNEERSHRLERNGEGWLLVCDVEDIVLDARWLGCQTLKQRAEALDVAAQRCGAGSGALARDECGGWRGPCWTQVPRGDIKHPVRMDVSDDGR